MISKTLGPWIRVNWKPKMFLSLFSVKVFLQFKDVWYETQSSSPIIQFILTITIDYNDEKLVLSILNNLPSSDFFPRLVSFSDFFSDCKWNIIWFARDHLYEFVFSSPEPKAQVSFFYHNLSVVSRCRWRRCRWRCLCLKLFTFSSCPETVDQYTCHVYDTACSTCTKPHVICHLYMPRLSAQATGICYLQKATCICHLYTNFSLLSTCLTFLFVLMILVTIQHSVLNTYIIISIFKKKLSLFKRRQFTVRLWVIEILRTSFYAKKSRVWHVFYSICSTIQFF